MPENISAFAVIGDIYESSYRPEQWPVALESITRITQSDSAVLIYLDKELPQASNVFLHNLQETKLNRYLSYDSDPEFKIILDAGPPGTIAVLDELFQKRKQLEIAYGKTFSNMVITPDLFHVAGSILFCDNSKTSALILHRKQTRGKWNQNQLETINTLIPHLQRSLNIQKKYIRLQAREHALSKGLDQLLMGLILFDKDSQPIYVNPVAKSILDYHPALSMINNRLVTDDAKASEAIQSALTTASSASDKHDSNEASTAFGLKHPDSPTRLPILISPAKGVLHGFETNGSIAHAVMCVSDPERSYLIESDRLAAAYELTPAEAQVAVSIANGLSVEEAAKINNVAVSTIRSQLKSIFRKLSVNSQAELVKVLLTGPLGQCT